MDSLLVNSQALQSFTANAAVFSDVSPFWHSLTSDSTVSDQETAADRAAVTNAARAAGVPVVPAVTDGTGTGQLASALADPVRQATVVQTLVKLAVSRGYDGLDLDLEGFAYADPKASWASTRPNWVGFVTALAGELHTRGRSLFATIPPTYDSNRGPSSGYWVYDYQGIASQVDRVRIMAYDYSVGSPGPIAPYNWVTRIVDYASTQVPRGKLVLGIPAYGRDWVTSVTGTCPAGVETARRSLSARAAWQVAADHGVSAAWDPTNRERTYTYADTFADGANTCVVARRVWFSDAGAVSERSRLAYSTHLAGIALWSIGAEDSQTWRALESLLPVVEPPVSGPEFFLNDSFTGIANTQFRYGDPGDTVYFGDWDGDGIDTPMVQRGNTFYARNSNTGGVGDMTFSYGNPGDVVLTGDWDGDGIDTLTVRRGHIYYVKNSITTGIADQIIGYGNADDMVLVGDWDGDGTETLTVRRGATYYVKDSISSGLADRTFVYGNPDDAVLVGDWDGNATGTLAVRRGNIYYLRNLPHPGSPTSSSATATRPTPPSPAIRPHGRSTP